MTITRTVTLTYPRSRSRIIAIVLLGALFGALAGCSSLLSTPPRHLYRVTPKSTYPANLPHVPAQLLIDVPLAPAGLDTSRIALSRSPVSIDYFADSEWTDRAPLLVQTALLESFENSHAVTALGRESVGLRADFILESEIRHFEAVYESAKAPPKVWVAINVKLVQMPDRRIIAQRSVSRTEQAPANDVPAIVSTFDDALGSVMKEIVVSTVSNPALAIPPR